MSVITIGDKISTINDIDNQNKNNYTKIMKYKNLDDEFNLVSLKSRYTLQKINSLMEENKDEEIDIDDLNDPKNSEYKNNILKRKIIQYYCRNKSDKNDFIPPSEEVIKKIRQFKKWQNFEIFQKNGVKNYLENLMPDYKIVHKTRDLIDNNVNLVTKIHIKHNSNDNNSTNILPKIINNCSSIEKDNELLFDKNQSFADYDAPKNYQRKIIRNKSMDEIIKKNYSKSKINQNSIFSKKNQKISNSKLKNKRKNSIISNNKSSSLIRFFDNSKKNESKFNNSKEIKSFEDSVFCLNKSLIPISIDKSIRTTQFGGALLHVNSLMRNKNINDLVPYYSPKKVQEKLRDYKMQRNKVIHNKDYMYHIDNTFITNKNNFNYYDYLIF